MRAITLHQPWASLIAHGVKGIETRSWPPPRSLVDQRIAIHAGKRIAGPRSLNPATRKAIEGLYGTQWPKVIPAGAVVATGVLSQAAKVVAQGGGRAWLVDGQATPEVANDPYGDFAPGRRTMHLGSRYCPGFGGQAAHCLTCGGCKACGLLAEYGSYRPKAESEQHPGRMGHHPPKD